jgi:hypothetical protein
MLFQVKYAYFPLKCGCKSKQLFDLCNILENNSDKNIKMRKMRKFNKKKSHHYS